MKVHVYPVDDTGTGWYRLRFPAMALQAQGADVHVIDDEIARATFSNIDGALTLVNVDPDTLPDCDVIVVQRVSSPTLCLLVEWLVAHGYRVVVDSDDDIHSISHGNQAKEQWRGKESIWARASRAASQVTCSTHKLQHRVGGILLPNCIPESYLSIEEPQGHNVGWTGTMKVHPHDLQVVGDAVARFDRPFVVVGQSEGVGKALGLPSDPPETGWLPIDQYPHAVARLGMGIVPLEPTSFNDSKSWLKGLEYAALGVPFIASPAAEYVHLTNMGIGVLAKRPRDWTRWLNVVAQDWDHHRGVNRERAASWTYERRAERWWEAWTTG